MAKRKRNRITQKNKSIKLVDGCYIYVGDHMPNLIVRLRSMIQEKADCCMCLHCIAKFLELTKKELLTWTGIKTDRLKGNMVLAREFLAFAEENFHMQCELT